MNRRRLAVLIRVRQELQKRAASLRPPRRWRGTASLLPELVPSVREALRSRQPEWLARQVRDATDAQPFMRPRAEPLPDAARLVREAEQLLAGPWNVFGAQVAIGVGAANWHTHPVSGAVAPLDHFSRIPYIAAASTGDIKHLWELNRHSELLRMAQAYYLTTDERFARRVVALLSDWIDHNPPEFGVNWVSALEVSLRLIAWCWIWRLTARSDAWTPDLIGKLLWAVSKSAAFIDRYDSIHHSPNTHLTGEALGLLYAGRMFPWLRRSRAWTQRGIDMLVTEARHQFLDDGFHYERSTGYHRYHLEYYLHAFALCRASGERWAEAFREPLSRALRVAALLRTPCGDWPLLGDEDGGCGAHLWVGSRRCQDPLLGLGAALLGDGRLVGTPTAAHASLAWWFGLEVPAGVPADLHDSFSFPAAGYFGARGSDADGDWYCVVDAGPHGGDLTGHAHTDLGHVEIALGASAIVTDPGCPVYAADPARRDFYRSLEAHASLVVDDLPLALPAGPFAWASVAPTPVVHVHDAESLWQCTLRYRVTPPIAHARTTLLVRGYGILVIDRVEGGGRHRLRWTWPLRERLVTGWSGDDTMVAGEAALAWTATAATRARIVDRMRSPSYGQEVPMCALELHMDAVDLPAVLVTAFFRASSRRPAVRFTTNGVVIELPDHGTLTVPADAPASIHVPRGVVAEAVEQVEVH